MALKWSAATPARSAAESLSRHCRPLYEETAAMLPVYTDDDIYLNDGRYCIELEGRVLSGTSKQGLLTVANARARAQQRPAQFLNAWKAAIPLAGQHFFLVDTPTVDAATDKNQLRPDFATITDQLAQL